MNSFECIFCGKKIDSDNEKVSSILVTTKGGLLPSFCFLSNAGFIGFEKLTFIRVYYIMII